MSRNLGVFSLYMWEEAPRRAPTLVLLAALTALSCARSQDSAAKVASPEPTPPPNASAAVVPLPTPALARAGGVNIADVVERVLPSVVSVSSKRATPSLPFGFGPPGSGLGSGVVVGPGLVVTNNHVVADADELKVKTADKRELPAKVLGTDPKSDLAVLEVSGDTKGLVPLELGDSSRLRLGDVVLAVGNPFGVGQTVTQGIVSAVARTQIGVTDYQFFIQTDAAINPGNSGGALVDMAGRLVGINTAIYSRTGGSLGIGFAIPVNMVRVVVDSARAGSPVVRRPWLGATLQEVTPDIAESLGLKRPAGALVANVSPNSPASQAGLRPGDVIVAIDGQSVEDPKAFEFRFVTRPLGSKAQLTIERAGRTVSTTVTLEAAPEAPREEVVIRSRSPFAGVKVANLSPALAEELRLDPTAEGVVIVEVASGSTADVLGFRPGDIVAAVNNERIAKSRDLERVAAKAAPQWDITIVRGGRQINVTFRG